MTVIRFVTQPSLNLIKDEASQTEFMELWDLGLRPPGYRRAVECFGSDPKLLGTMPGRSATRPPATSDRRVSLGPTPMFSGTLPAGATAAPPATGDRRALAEGRLDDRVGDHSRPKNGPKSGLIRGPKNRGQKTDPIFDATCGHPQWVPARCARFWGHFWFLETGPCFQAVKEPDLDAQREPETMSRRALGAASIVTESVSTHSLDRSHQYVCDSRCVDRTEPSTRSRRVVPPNGHRKWPLLPWGRMKTWPRTNSVTDARDGTT